MAKVSPLMIAPPLLFAALAGLFYWGMGREDADVLPSQLIGKAVPVPLQAGKFTFQLGAIPEQLQEPLVLGRLSAQKQLLGNGCHSTLQT